MIREHKASAFIPGVSNAKVQQTANVHSSFGKLNNFMPTTKLGGPTMSAQSLSKNVIRAGGQSSFYGNRVAESQHMASAGNRYIKATYDGSKRTPPQMIGGGRPYAPGSSLAKLPVDGPMYKAGSLQAAYRAQTSQRRTTVTQAMAQPEQANPQKKIVVLGSLNYDVFLKMQRMPELGETLAADDDIFKAFGGKGANQAVSAAKLVNQDCKVQMLGQVGSDDEGKAYLQYLAENGIDSSGIIVRDDVPTGQAYILSIDRDNSILIIGGSNTKYESELAIPEVWKDAIKSADILMLQREIPEQINAVAAKFARENDVKVILDMGGKDDPLSPELLKYVDIVSPNQTELTRLTNAVKEGSSTEEYIDAIMKEYPDLDVLFKMGVEGSRYYERDPNYMDRDDGKLIMHTEQKAFDFKDFQGKGVELVDTTGAGDSFTGAYAVAILEGKSQQEAMEFACKAAFLTVSKMGAGPAMPQRDELDKFFASSEPLSAKRDENGKIIIQNPKDLSNHHFCALIRHAERADRVDEYNPTHKVPKDPPLSSEGLKQAKVMGEYMKEYIAQNNIKYDKIVIQTSPFTRCMQTAYALAEAMGVKEVDINYLVSEHLQTDDFPEENPLKVLESQNGLLQDHEKLMMYGLDPSVVKFNDTEYFKEQIKSKWPEDLKDSHLRAMQITEMFTNKVNDFKKENPNGEKICYLVCSHGMMVEQQGNIIEKTQNDANFSMPTPGGYNDFSDNYKMIEAVKHLDWSGVPIINYCCMNAFSVKPDLSEFEWQKVKDNIVMDLMEEDKK